MQSVGDMNQSVKPNTIVWQLTPWQMNGEGSWKQQPIITAEGVRPFFADHPKDYMKRLKEMHAGPSFARGQFHMLIGELRDGLEQAWNLENAPKLAGKRQ